VVILSIVPVGAYLLRLGFAPDITVKTWAKTREKSRETSLAWNTTQRSQAGNLHVALGGITTIAPRPGRLYNLLMSTTKYTYWKSDEMWLGYLEEFPDYWTQGESLDELCENLKDLYQELTSGVIPGVRRVAELQVS
jgi:predicted RNase H-like HicB family nuclease